MFPLPRFGFADGVTLSGYCAAVSCNLSSSTEEAAFAEGVGGLDLVEEPEVLFDRLSRGSTTLTAVELFSLLVWDSSAWESDPAEKVVRHLWNSIVHQGDLRQIALYRVLLANKEKWPGPDPLIRLLSADLKARLLLQWPDKSQARILMCLANEDAQGLAAVIIKAHDADLPARYLRRLKLLGRLPVAEAALPFWIAGWASLNQAKRSGLAKQVGLSHVLEGLDFTRSLHVAGLILDDAAIQQKMQDSRESWPILEAWFRQKNSDALWRNGLTDVQRQRLEQWLRSVNFRDFQRWSRRIISALPGLLADHEFEQCEKQQNQLNRRVIYWQNYQRQFKQVRFLLPSETLEIFREDDEDLEIGTNVSVLGQHHAGCEVGIFHVGEYCLIEFFRGRLSELRILKAEDAPRLFSQERWTLEGLRALAYEWIQDHSYFWQSELVFVLDKIFSIRPDDTRVLFGEHQWFLYGGNWLLKPEQQKDRDSEIKRWAYHLDGVGKRQWEQQRRRIDQLLGRAVELPQPVEEVKTPQPPIEVKAPAPPISGWYKVDGNGQRMPANAMNWAAVSDAKSGLMWAVSPSKSANFPNPVKAMTWHDAQEWVAMVNRLSWGGFCDWRLPTVEELESLLTRKKAPRLHIREDLFSDISSVSYIVWTSSLGSGGYERTVNFHNGRADNLDKNCNRYVRVVRSGQ